MGKTGHYYINTSKSDFKKTNYIFSLIYGSLKKKYIYIYANNVFMLNSEVRLFSRKERI